jgi:nitrous oxide reductase accessory protein NosL
MSRPAHSFAPLMTIAALLAACEREPLTGPPELRLGRDECRECGMLIYEDRAAAALLLESPAGREHALFDDIGCMLDFERTPGENETVLARFVRDYAARTWLDADRAAYLFAHPDHLPTPMASGIAAFADTDAAESQRARAGGELLTFNQITAARAQWKSDRLSPTAPAAPAPH